MDAGTRLGGVGQDDGYTSLGMKEPRVAVDRTGPSRCHALILTSGKTVVSTSGTKLGFDLSRACTVLRSSLITQVSLSHSREVAIGAANIFYTAVASVHRLGHELRDVPSQRQE